jgi:hypothetical protein
MVCETDAVSQSMVELSRTHFFPKQFLGPNENGLRASFRSEAYSAAPSGRKRSGANVSGFLKFVMDRNAAYIGH